MALFFLHIESKMGAVVLSFRWLRTKDYIKPVGWVEERNPTTL